MSRPLSFGKGKAGAANPADSTKFPSSLVEVTTFFAGPVPEEIKASVPLFHTLSMEHVTELITLSSQYLQQDSKDFVIHVTFYEKFPSPEVANTLLTATFLILRTALRNKVKISVIKTDLLAMNLPSNVVDKLCEEMVQSRKVLESVAVRQQRIRLPALEKVRWRIDVSISSGSLSRVMRPNILMQLVKKDGTVSTFEVSLEQFNQLRYSVAKVLNDINTMERHPIIRIVNEFRRREEEEYNN